MKICINENCPQTEIIINCPRITDEILRLEAVLRGFERKLYGSKDGKTHLLDSAAALYFESVDKRCFICTADDVFETPLRLYQIEEMLAEAGFFRSSKSQIVNIAAIASLRPDFGGRIEITLENGEKLLVSRQYAGALKERLGLK